MPFQKGQSGNPSGRRKGAVNRSTDEVRASLVKLLDDNLSQLQRDIKAMKGKDRAQLLINLAKHCTPPALNPERLTEDQLKQIIQYLQDENRTKKRNQGSYK